MKRLLIALLALIMSYIATFYYDYWFCIFLVMSLSLTAVSIADILDNKRSNNEIKAD